MTAKQHLLRFVDTGGEVRRPPWSGCNFFMSPAVSLSDLGSTRPRLKAKDLIGLLFRHFAGTRPVAEPRCRVTLHVLTPFGLPAVKIRCQ